MITKIAQMLMLISVLVFSSCSVLEDTFLFEQAEDNEEEMLTILASLVLSGVVLRTSASVGDCADVDEDGCAEAAMDQQ